MRDFIFDQHAGVCVASIENQEVFRNRDGVNRAGIAGGSNS